VPRLSRHARRVLRGLKFILGHTTVARPIRRADMRGDAVPPDAAGSAFAFDFVRPVPLCLAIPYTGPMALLGARRIGAPLPALAGDIS
jgi:hypothetical protein